MQCMTTIPSFRDLLNSSKLDASVVEPLPLKKVIFEAFKDHLIFLDRDTLQKTLIFYSRLDEAQRLLEIGRRPVHTGSLKETAEAALRALGEAYVEGQQ